MAGKKHAGFKDELEADEHRRTSLFQGLTRRQGADVSGKAGTTPDLRGMLLAAYGPGARGGVNTAAAAKDLGVSRRTVERWVAPEGRQRIAKPKTDTLQKLTTKSRQSATTQQGRRAAIKSVRESKQGKSIAKYGARVKIKGRQGVAGGGGFYIRDRSIQIPPDQGGMSPSDVEAMWSAYERGGDKELSKWLSGYASDKYVDGWTFESIDNISIDPI